MLETALVLLAVAATGLVGLLGPLLAARPLATLGLMTLFVGLLLGLPTGLWYHVMLYRCVAGRVALRRTWWMSPAHLHRHLTDEEHWRIRTWYRLGGVGFVLCVAGGVAAMAGLLLAQW